MRYFMIEGSIQEAEKMTQRIMNEHMAYTQKAMDDGMVLMSGLKSNKNGCIFLMKSETQDTIEAYLAHEPFHVHGIQTYTIVEFRAHYVNSAIKQWLQN